MLKSLHWRTALRSPEAEAQLHDLRHEALRLFLVLTTLGYVAWHHLSVVIWPGNATMTRIFTILPIAALYLGVTYFLLPRSREAASAAFIGGGLVAILWAIAVAGAPQAVWLIPLVAMCAAFIIHPLGGFLVAGLGTILLELLPVIKPGAVGASEIWSVAVFSVAAVVGVWAMIHHVFLALNWYADAYRQAEQRAAEAQEHRAQLVQAWKQLDLAYYRLERANAALQAAWKAADEAERAKMELATNVSHEFRTPLNLIAGYTDMMMSSPDSYGGTVLPAPYRGDLVAIYRSAQHLLALSDDVHDLGRLDVGRPGLVRDPNDLGQIVADAVALVRDYVTAKGIDLAVDISPAIPILAIDRLRIRQVVLNLLTNAARWTERGRIDIGVRPRDRDIRVSVSDTGPGIPPDELPGVFRRFVTRDEGRTAGRTGTGLGLPISKQFVELHGGEMGVDSTVGEGTTFWFTLPTAVPGASGSRPISGSLHPGYLRPQEPILVLAQPDPRLAHLFQRHLDDYRLEVAQGLDDAMRRALDLKATAIIADQDATATSTDCSVPIVRCLLPHHDRLVANLRVADYLVKPVFRETLLRAIRDVEGPVKRILIADDDRHFVRLLERMLCCDAASYDVATAFNGEEALALLRNDQPDLLLLDLIMPGVGGLEVLHALVTDPRLEAIKVIVISARDEEEGFLPLGHDLRISKPEGFRLVELARMISAALSKMTPVREFLSATEPAPAIASSG